MAIIKNPLIVIGSGGTSILIEKSITANGVYNASSDDADGFSKVTVNVPVAQPTLFTPTISIDYLTSALIITDGNGNFASYEIYAKTTGDYVRVQISTSKEINLEELFPEHNSDISLKVKATGTDFNSSSFSNVLVWEYGTGTAGLAYTLSNDGTYYICSGIGTVDTTTVTDIEIGSVHYDASQSADVLPVTKIAASAFYRNTTITSVSIPSSVSVIEGYAFNGCSNLIGVSLSVGLTEIGDAAFMQTKIARVIIPEGITSLAYGVFSSINRIQAVFPSTLISLGLATCQSSLFARWIFKSTIPPSILTNTFSGSEWGSALGLFYVPYTSINDYKTETNWTTYASLINPLVNTVSDLSSIDTTSYTKACVVGNEEYTEYQYTNGQWEVVQ